MRHFALTLKWNSNPNPDRSDYARELYGPVLNKQFTITKWAYETDSKNKLHLHAHVCTKYFHWKTYITQMTNKGYHTNIQELKSDNDRQQWDNYLTKQSLNEHECAQVNASNDIRSCYSFIDGNASENNIKT